MKFDPQPLLSQTFYHLAVQNVHFIIYRYFVLRLKIEDHAWSIKLAKHENEANTLSCLSSASSLR